MTVTVYHNPACGTSRNVLALLKERGIAPVIIDYLKNPPTEVQLNALIAQSGLPVRAFLRTKEKLYGELDLARAAWTDRQLIGFLAQHPALLNRPVVASPRGVRPCRPAEIVLELL